MHEVQIDTSFEEKIPVGIYKLFQEKDPYFSYINYIKKCFCIICTSLEDSIQYKKS